MQLRARWFRLNGHYGLLHLASNALEASFILFFLLLSDGEYNYMWVVRFHYRAHVYQALNPKNCAYSHSTVLNNNKQQKKNSYFRTTLAYANETNTPNLSHSLFCLRKNLFPKQAAWTVTMEPVRQCAPPDNKHSPRKQVFSYSKAAHLITRLLCAKTRVAGPAGNPELEYCSLIRLQPAE